MRKPSVPATILMSLVGIVGGCASHDLVVPVERQFSTRVAVAGIQGYRDHVSPKLAGRIQCRFVPTCSLYGLESVKKHGGLKGGLRAIGRIARCNPMTQAGTVDPP